MCGQRNKSAAGDQKLHWLRDNIYLYRGYFSNSCVFLFSTCVLIVDTQVSPIAGQRLKNEIRKITDLPIKYVINTHHHGDHIGGNAVFKEATIIGSELTQKLAIEKDHDRVEYAKAFGLNFQEWHPPFPPTTTFNGTHTLMIDDEMVVISHLGKSETEDACVVFFPKRLAVAVGDSVSTHDYPFMGTPFLDEGLRDDGEWIGALRRIQNLNATLLLPGHGHPLQGSEIEKRLTLLIALYSDLLNTTRPLVEQRLPVPEIVARVNEQLADYRRHPGLQEKTLCQRFAIYRCINSIDPERKGKGWWQDLRPSVVKKAPISEMEEIFKEISTEDELQKTCEIFIKNKEVYKAISLLELYASKHQSSQAYAFLSDILFDQFTTVKPAVDATEFIVEAKKAYENSLAINPQNPLALLSKSIIDIFGGMILAQDMSQPIAMLEQLEKTHHFSKNQKKKLLFFLGKAHQLSGDFSKSDFYYKKILPPVVRMIFPVIVNKFRRYP